MNTIINRLRNLRHKVNGGSYTTPGENALADDLLEVIDIVGDLALEVKRNSDSAIQAANVASCLANGIKPD